MPDYYRPVMRRQYPAVIYASVIAGENLWMDSQERRRHWLRKLIAERFGGKQARFIDATGENQGMISALLSGKKKFGEDLSLNLAKRLNKEDGPNLKIDPEFFEQPPDQVATPSDWDTSTIEWANWFQSLAENERKRMTVMALLLRDGADFGKIAELIPALPQDYTPPPATTGGEVRPKHERDEETK